LSLFEPLPKKDKPASFLSARPYKVKKCTTIMSDKMSIACRYLGAQM